MKTICWNLWPYPWGHQGEAGKYLVSSLQGILILAMIGSGIHRQWLVSEPEQRTFNVEYLILADLLTYNVSSQPNLTSV